MKFNQKTFKTKDLKLIPDKLEFARQYFAPLECGELVTLNSGGPPGKILSSDGEILTISWPCGEHKISKKCVKRWFKTT